MIPLLWPHYIHCPLEYLPRYPILFSLGTYYYRTNCRLEKSRPNPEDGNNGGRVYTLSPQINPPLSLVKEESNIRGKSQVTLGGNDTKHEMMEVIPLQVKILSEIWIGNDSWKWLIVS
jgi:hypothetical protein